MEDWERDEELIGRFVRKELSDTELQTFKKRLSADKRLAQQLALYTSAQEVMEEIKREDILQMMKEGDRSGPGWGKGLLIGGAIALVAFLLFYLLQPTPLPQMDEGQRIQALDNFIEQEKKYLNVAGGSAEDNNWRRLLLQEVPDFAGALLILDRNIAATKEPCESTEQRYFAGALHLYYDQNLSMAESLLKCAADSQTFGSKAESFFIECLAYRGKRRQARQRLQSADLTNDQLKSRIRNYLE